MAFGRHRQGSALVLAATLGAGGLAGCQNQTGAELQSVDSSDGQLSFGMVPLRAHIEVRQRSRASAVALDNASRLVYGLVRCSGGGAVTRMRQLEALAHKDYEAIHRDGRRLLDHQGRALADAAGCELVGDHVLTAPVFLRLTGSGSHAVANDLQQLLWLLVRGADEKRAVLKIAAHAFVYEGVGSALEREPNGLKTVINERDLRFSPCTEGTNGFEKRRLYQCSDGNYVFAGKSADLEATVGKLSQAISQASRDLKRAVDALPRGQRLRAAGYVEASEIAATNAELEAMAARAQRLSDAGEALEVLPIPGEQEKAWGIMASLAEFSRAGIAAWRLGSLPPKLPVTGVKSSPLRHVAGQTGFGLQGTGYLGGDSVTYTKTTNMPGYPGWTRVEAPAGNSYWSNTQGVQQWQNQEGIWFQGDKNGRAQEMGYFSGPNNVPVYANQTMVYNRDTSTFDNGWQPSWGSNNDWVKTGSDRYEDKVTGAVHQWNNGGWTQINRDGSEWRQGQPGIKWDAGTGLYTKDGVAQGASPEFLGMPPSAGGVDVNKVPAMDPVMPGAPAPGFGGPDASIPGQADVDTSSPGIDETGIK